MNQDIKPKGKYQTKVYNDAYNNPNQYDINKMKDGELTNVIIQAITDRRKDEAAGTFKYK